MIGIIGDELDSLSIIESISKKYPQINIYFSKMNTKEEEKIKTLKSKNCKIIILSKTSKKLRENYEDIFFVSIERKIKQDFFLFPEDLICKALITNNINKIEEIFKKIEISKSKKILLKSPKLLWIKSLIKKRYNNEIISINDILLEEISKIIKDNNLNPQENGIRSMIM